MTRRARILWVTVAIALSVGVVVTRVAWEGVSALSTGSEAARNGDHEGAIRWWRRAARWYLPGASYVDAAYANLEELATTAEASGERDVALAAWRAIRRSVLATRSVYTPHGDRLDRANEHIATLMAAGEVEARKEHLALLLRPVGPSVSWSLVALLGLAMWLGGAFLFALRGVGRNDRLQVGPARLAAVLVAVGLVVWMLGLYKA